VRVIKGGTNVPLAGVGVGPADWNKDGEAK